MAHTNKVGRLGKRSGQTKTRTKTGRTIPTSARRSIPLKTWTARGSLPRGIPQIRRGATPRTLTPGWLHSGPRCLALRMTQTLHAKNRLQRANGYSRGIRDAMQPGYGLSSNPPSSSPSLSAHPSMTLPGVSAAAVSGAIAMEIFRSGRLIVTENGMSPCPASSTPRSRPHRRSWLAPPRRGVAAPTNSRRRGAGCLGLRRQPWPPAVHGPSAGQPRCQRARRTLMGLLLQPRRAPAHVARPLRDPCRRLRRAPWLGPDVRAPVPRDSHKRHRRHVRRHSVERVRYPLIRIAGGDQLCRPGKLPMVTTDEARARHRYDPFSLQRIER